MDFTAVAITVLEKSLTVCDTVIRSWVDTVQ